MGYDVVWFGKEFAVRGERPASTVRTGKFIEIKFSILLRIMQPEIRR